MRKTRLLSILALLLVAATGAWAQVGTPLTLEAKTAGTIQVKNPQNHMKYSKNGGAKTVMTTTQTIDIDVAVGDKVQFYGDGTSIPRYYGTHIEGGDAECYIYGNIMSLVDENGFATATALSEPLTFTELFYGNENLYNHPTNKLVLPATTLAEYCYYSMFAACRSLTSAPELPATTLAVGCYAFMFNECSSLTSAPELPATTLAVGCYYSMFYNCNSLTSAPELPATTLAEECYFSMFKSCNSLTSAPELPATTLAEYCYAYMFHDCNSLTSAPELHATTLADGCYAYMFKGCESLNSVTCLATNISAESSTEEWLADVAATGTFTKAPGMGNWGTGISGIPQGWTTKDYSPEPAATYTVALADNTEDAANWQAKVGNAEEFSGLPLQGVAEDDSVTLAYNGNLEVMSVKVVKKATPARPLAEATAEDLGKIVGADGNIYDTQQAASNAGTTAVAMIAYVGSETHTTYTHGLAIALSDEGSMVWSTAKSTCEGKTAITDAAWLLPSKDQWNTMFYANGGNNASCTGLNTAISNAGGTALVAGIYWTASSTESQTGHWIALISGEGVINFYQDSDNNNDHVRAALAF